MLSLITLILYLLGTYLFWRRIKGGDQSAGQLKATAGSRGIYIAIAALLSVLHGWQIYDSLTNKGELNLALGNIFSMVCLMTMIMFAFGALVRQITNLGIIVLPIGFLGLIASSYTPGPALILHQAPPSLWLHLTIAILAFGFLCIAAVQAILLFLQEKKLRSANPGSLFPALPAIQTMESNMVQLTLFGVILLSVNLITGLVSSWQVHGKTIEFNHHILLSVLAWIGFSALLIGRKLFGWRGQVAAKWTLIAFFILILAYFGTRIVTSIILA
ncbi:MAG: cytochrome c biogenesis protein CcsA [Acidiferrobacterales bacterium]|nr:cytochrome c biogenesis protein CcsA [Acidiferrobacterales bacterium]